MTWKATISVSLLGDTSVGAPYLGWAKKQFRAFEAMTDGVFAFERIPVEGVRVEFKSTGRVGTIKIWGDGGYTGIICRPCSDSAPFGWGKALPGVAPVPILGTPGGDYPHVVATYSGDSAKSYKLTRHPRAKRRYKLPLGSELINPPFGAPQYGNLDWQHWENGHFLGYISWVGHVGRTAVFSDTGGVDAVSPSYADLGGALRRIYYNSAILYWGYDEGLGEICGAARRGGTLFFVDRFRPLHGSDHTDRLWAVKLATGQRRLLCSMEPLPGVQVFKYPSHNYFFNRSANKAATVYPRYVRWEDPDGEIEWVSKTKPFMPGCSDVYLPRIGNNSTPDNSGFYPAMIAVPVVIRLTITGEEYDGYAASFTTEVPPKREWSTTYVFTHDGEGPSEGNPDVEPWSYDEYYLTADVAYNDVVWGIDYEGDTEVRLVLSETVSIRGHSIDDRPVGGANSTSSETSHEWTRTWSIVGGTRPFSCTERARDARTARSETIPYSGGGVMPDGTILGTAHDDRTASWDLISFCHIDLRHGQIFFVRAMEDWTSVYDSTAEHNEGIGVPNPLYRWQQSKDSAGQYWYFKMNDELLESRSTNVTWAWGEPAYVDVPTPDDTVIFPHFPGIWIFPGVFNSTQVQAGENAVIPRVDPTASVVAHPVTYPAPYVGNFYFMWSTTDGYPDLRVGPTYALTSTDRYGNVFASVLTPTTGVRGDLSPPGRFGDPIITWEASHTNILTHIANVNPFYKVVGGHPWFDLVGLV